MSIYFYDSNLDWIETWYDYPYCPRIGDKVEIQGRDRIETSVKFKKSAVSVYTKVENE